MTSGCIVWLTDLLRRRGCIGGPVLDVGSQDVNGSCRGIFEDPGRFPSYVGVDLQAGKAVDVLGKGDALPFRDGAFGVVVCTETLEHDDRFWLSLREFHRLLAATGTVIVTTRGIGFPRHDYPSDYWRFTAEGLRTALAWAGFRDIDAVEDRDDGGTFAVAAKGPGGTPALPPADGVPALLSEEEVARLRERFAGFVPLGMTSVADAFERVAADRALLLGLVEDAQRLLDGYSSETVHRWFRRVRRARGEEA